jgi:hypothetical protein
MLYCSISNEGKRKLINPGKPIKIEDAIANLVEINRISTPSAYADAIFNSRESRFNLRYVAAVLAAIKAVAEIVSVFNKMDADKKKNEILAEILLKLIEISNEIKEIRRELKEIRDQLIAIEGAINEIPTVELLVALDGIVDTIVDNYRVWSATTDPILLTNTDNTRLKLSDTLNSLIHRGFAHAFDVALGFSHEMNLWFSLGIEDKLQERSQRLLSYLRQSIDEAVPNSIGYYNKVSILALAKLESWQKKLPSEVFLEKAEGVTDYEEKGWRKACFYNWHAVYVGTLGQIQVVLDPRDEESCRWHQAPSDTRSSDQGSGPGVMFLSSVYQAYLRLKNEVEANNRLYSQQLYFRDLTRESINGIEAVITSILDRVEVQIASKK